MRSDILHQLHAAHLGIENTRLLMRESVYWPNIYEDIETMVKCGAVCQESQAEHRQQPLLAHDVNNQHCNRKQVCTMVHHVWTTTRNSNRQRPTVCRAACLVLAKYSSTDLFALRYRVITRR